jgi:tRNA dimethylallyltransferase
MDIGTAKPNEEEQKLVAHHLIDIVNPDEQYDAARFVADALAAIKKIASRNRTVLLTGGTGLYLKSLVDGLFNTLPTDSVIRSQLEDWLNKKGNQELHKELCRVDAESGARIHENDTHRVIRGLEIFKTSGKTWTEHLKDQKKEGQGIEFTNMFQVALTCERSELHKRIKQRTHIMLEQGFIEEVRQLLKIGYSETLSSMQSIGYRHVNNYLSGLWDQDTMVELLIRDTRRYAKRQMTWFGKNTDLHWFERTESKKIIKSIEEYLA